MKLSNNKGYALAMILALLPAVVGLFFLAFTVVGLTQFDQATKYACRESGLKAQDKVAVLLRTLLGLNTLATTLKAEAIAANIALIIATASLEPEPIRRAYNFKKKVDDQRRALDKRQKQIVSASNNLLRLAHISGHTQITLASRKGLPNIPFLKLTFRQQLGKAPRLSVKPDSSELAPTYSPLPDLESRQALAHKWQYLVSVRNPFQMFLDGKIEFQRSCEVTLKKEGSSWIAKIRRDRSSLR